MKEGNSWTIEAKLGVKRTCGVEKKSSTREKKAGSEVIVQRFLTTKRRQFSESRIMG